MPDAKDKTGQDISADLVNFFENFLKPGIVVIEETIADGMRLKIKALTASELIAAESMIRLNNPAIPIDIIHKIRGAAILSQAILEMNDMVIDRPDMTVPENRQRREQLYRSILDFPPLLIQKAYEAYLRAVDKQNSLYNDVQELDKKIENF